MSLGFRRLNQALAAIRCDPLRLEGAHERARSIIPYPGRVYELDRPRMFNRE
jgi:hypothetical protein